MCSEIIACHSLSDSLWHRATIIEMSRDHNVTAERVSDMNYSDIAPCEECLWGEADGWRSHGPGWKGPVRRRLRAEFRMSSYVFRETEVGVCYFCVCASEDLWGKSRRGTQRVFTNYEVFKVLFGRCGRVFKGHMKEFMEKLSYTRLLLWSVTILIIA